MKKTCTSCSCSFEISEEDIRFLVELSPVIAGKTFDLPPPTLCIDDRQRRRVAISNQLNLYERTCDLTGRKVISNFSPDSEFTVYYQPDWYSDKWDPVTFGRDFDFSRPFFDQFYELTIAVPHPSLFTGYQYDENCDYTNHAGKNKDCYLIFDSDECRDCYYSYSVNSCENCMDCFRARKCQLCYECIDCVKCYNSLFLQDCENCSDSAFLKNSIGCKNCILSSNLRNKQYYVENKEVSPKEFEQVRNTLTSRARIEKMKKRFDMFKLNYPQKYIHGVQNENVVGDYLVQCKNAYMCFDSEELWDCRYVFQGFMPLKNCMDIQECGEAERLYECAFVGYNAHSTAFTSHTLGSVSNVNYCQYCPHAKNLFGCIGLRHKEHCVLNKQYSKEGYEELVLKIIEHMRKTGEWGEFFPIQYSMSSYNETLAQEYLPLSREDVLSKGWKWDDALEKKDIDDTMSDDAPHVADDINDADDSVTTNVYQCTVTGKAFKIIEQELNLSRQMQVPLPEKTFFQRHKERQRNRNPRTLYNRNCAQCQKPIQTTYSPDSPETVYCEGCYMMEVY